MSCERDPKRPVRPSVRSRSRRRALRIAVCPGLSVRWRSPEMGAGERGQALLLLVAALAVVLIGAAVLGGLARASGAEGDAQRAADLAALAGARRMQADYPRLFEPPLVDDLPNPRHLERSEYLARAREAATDVAHRNGAGEATVAFPGKDGFAPLRVAVAVGGASLRAPYARHGAPARASARAEAELDVGAGVAPAASASGGGYDGPLAYRQGKPMRPDVALAFDRMGAAARADGVSLVINSAYRSDAAQAKLYAAHPDPKWVAPPGKSLHRLGTELDLGPPSAYPWLRANAGRFHFVQRYSWEPWHYGYTLNAGSRLAFDGGDGSAAQAAASFVPSRYVPAISRAAQRWNVAAALLAAQLYRESSFNPFAVSPAGAQGIAQFMPGTARQYGLDDPFDPGQAIDAQAHLMRDLLRRFGSVPLALAAYNAGPDRVARCGCVPAIPETQAYVAAILGLLGGAGQAFDQLSVRLLR